MHIVGYFKEHIRAVLLVLLLLVIQAACDLALPTLTSQIVDVGIQQSGVESVAVDAMSKDTFEKVCSITEEKDAALVRQSYDEDSNNIFHLNAFGREHKGELERILTKPLIAIHSTTEHALEISSDIASFDEMYHAYQAGEIDRERAIAFLNHFTSEKLGEDMLRQQANTRKLAITYPTCRWDFSLAWEQSCWCLRLSAC